MISIEQIYTLLYITHIMYFLSFIPHIDVHMDILSAGKLHSIYAASGNTELCVGTGD